MDWTSRARRLLAARRPGHSLPQGFYVDPAMHEADLHAVFGTQWLFAGNVSEIPEPGDRMTFEVGRTSVLLVRDEAGQDGGGIVRGFHNTCRHRGSRLCATETASGARLACPYHGWVYGLDGSLIHASAMGGGFDRSSHGLRPVHVEAVCGLIFVCFADDPPDIAAVRAAATPYLAMHRPERCKVAATSTLVERANWKLVIENNRECYHCDGNHPELLRSLVDFPIGDINDVDDDRIRLLRDAHARWMRDGVACAVTTVGRAFRLVRLPFQAGVRSMTMDGELGCRKLLGDLIDPDLGSVRMFLAPNSWHHVLSDHIIHFRVTPLGPEETLVRTTWLVHEDAIEGWDYDPARLREVWETTNDQDRRLAENNHAGIASTGYLPGPYAPVTEGAVINFVEWYADTLGRSLDGGVALAAE